MANQFVFYGKIVPAKATEKFAPIERKKYQSGWTNTICKFNVLSGTNRIMCVTQGGKWEDDSRNVIKTTGQIPEGKKKRETVTISWDKRFDQDQIDKVAGFRHYVVDLDDSRKRYKLRDLVEAFKKGNDTSKLIEETGCNTLAEAQELLEKSEKRRHVFITTYDFAEYMTKVVTSDKIKDKIFKISGNQEISYSNGKFYSNYVVNRVELMPDAAPDTNMIVDFYFTKDCINEDNNVARISGWSKYYDSGIKKSGFYPVSIAIRNEKDINLAKKRFVADTDEVMNIGITVNVINGADSVRITMDDLDDETKENIEAGWTTFEKVVREMGGNKIGEHISELRFSGLNMRQNKGKTDHTTFSVDNMTPAIKVAQVEDEEEDL